MYNCSSRAVKRSMGLGLCNWREVFCGSAYAYSWSRSANNNNSNNAYNVNPSGANNNNNNVNNAQAVRPAIHHIHPVNAVLHESEYFQYLISPSEYQADMIGGEGVLVPPLSIERQGKYSLTLC